MEAVDLNILGATELAQRWGTSRQHVDHLVKSPAMGRPKQLSCGRIWTLSQVLEYEQWRTESGLGPVLPAKFRRNRKSSPK